MHDSDQLVQEAISAGANGYVLKADAGRMLVDAVRAILSTGEFFSDTCVWWTRIARGPEGTRRHRER